MQSVPITTNAVSSIPAHAEEYSMQHYVIKFVSDLRQVGGFIRVLRFPPPIKLTNDRTEILLQVALRTINKTKPDNLFVILLLTKPDNLFAILLLTKPDNLFTILLFEFKNMYSSKHLILHCSH